MKIKVLLAMTLVLLLAGVTTATPAEPVKVAVFPFDIFSQEPLPALRQGLQEMLSQRLAQEGITVLPMGQVNTALKEANAPLDLTLARQLAGKLGADYGVYGSLTKIGNRVSLDAKVMDVLGMSRPQSVYVEGLGMDQLDEMAGRMVLELTSRMKGVARVAEVKIEGNRRIEEEAIKAIIKTQVGSPYSPLRLDEDLREVWKMGYFDDVQVRTEDGPQGKVVIFAVQEKPQVREVRVFGAKAIDEKDIRDQIGIKPFSVFKAGEVKLAEAKINKLYRDKGYYDIKVSSQVLDLANGDKAVSFTVDEGSKLFIKAIRFRGNKAFDSGDLRDVMSTSEEGWFTWITESNILDRTQLDQDRERLHDFYYNHGYMTARVSEPVISREGDGLVVTFDVVEGNRFKVGSITISGDMLKDREEMMKLVSTKPGEWFSRETLRMDLAKLQDLYADQGYAYVQVRPRVQEDMDKNLVSVDLNITQGQKVYFERIVISGNNYTRDKVIRRELGVAEGDLFSSRAIRNSNVRLHRLDFFEDINITTSKGSTPDKMNLKVDVKEKRTGSFSIGAGYSTVDSFMVMGSISEANLFGRGQRLEFQGQLGGASTRFTLSFTEPWLFDRPISAGADIYDWEREFSTYDKEAKGARLRLGFPTPYRYTRFYAYYLFEEATITNISDTAAIAIKDQEGTHTTSSVRFILRRDSRDHHFNPTHGSDNSISIEYAGLGGSNAFTKVIADSGWYFPLWFKHVAVIHGRMGYVVKNSGGDLPVYEKFFLGGISTLRGFDYQSVSPRDPATDDPIGGEYMALLNLEYRFPVLTQAGLVGVLFYDTGNAWDEETGYDFSDLKQSVGAGIRWLSPVGPLRLEYGYVLDRQPGEAQSNWEFTIGSTF